MSHVLKNTLVAIVSTGSLASSLLAQCADWVEQPPLRRTGVVRAVTRWDPDGPGPLPEWLVVAGQFERAQGQPVSNIAAWDGSAWHALGAGIVNTNGLGVRALAVYNGQLVAGGSFSFAGEEVTFNIARWDGSSWSSLGDGIFGDSASTAVESLAVYNNELIAAGHFSDAGGSTTRNIARWNGTFWRSLDSGINGLVPSECDVSALTVYNGELYAGGHFSIAGASACNNIARWNGSTWNPVSGGIGLGNSTDRVLALTVHDNELMVGGYFTGIGGVTACNNIAGWNGSTWRGLGVGQCGLNNYVYALTSFDGLLYASGFFDQANGQPAQHIARWNGDDWYPLGEGTDAWTGTLGTYNNELIAGGYFLHAGPYQAEGLARWNGSAWLPTAGVTSEPTGRIDAIASWGGRVILGGSQGSLSPLGSPAGFASVLSAWDGDEMSSIGHPNSTVRAMITRQRLNHSTDLIIGGDFTTIDGVDANRIALINDTLAGGWQRIGDGFNGNVNAIEVYNGNLFAAGTFTASGSINLSFIARWNGAFWEALASGVNGAVYTMKSYHGLLYVGGSFTNAGGVSSPGIAAWNGSNWTSVHPTAFAGSVYSLKVYDDTLIIGGEFPGFQGSRNIVWHNGTFFGPFGIGANGAVRAMTVSNDSLVVGGDFTAVNGLGSDHLARWTGHAWPPPIGAWSPMSGATDGPVRALATFANEVHVGGEFMDVRNDSLYAPLWARFSETGVPWLAEQPSPSSVQCRHDAAFSVVAASGYDGLQYQWRKDGMALTNGPTPTGSTIILSGPSLRILGVFQGDAGAYDCVISNSCGMTTSAAAVLTVTGNCPICPADFNADGTVNSQDFFDFLNAFFQDGPGADFNHNGTINSQDFFDFLAAFFVGC